ncbi:hypothetical protein BJ912DRAFT_1063115 [Pholiota molesta]|nr:hypothetical protein BJ912DRAFT_1063115 [Pholiota molesta]
MSSTTFSYDYSSGSSPEAASMDNPEDIFSTQTLAPPPATSYTPDTSVDPGMLFIDNVSKEFGLGPIRISHLTALYKLGSSLDGSLTTADLWTRVFAVACQFSVEQNITQAIQSATGNTSNAVGGDLKRILDELTIRLDANFQLTSEQTITVRRICQEMIYQPRRVSFKNIHIEVDKVMRKNAVAYRLDNIFAVPARESKWVSDLKKITSSVRNAFRQDLRDSVIGPKQTSLEKFTAESAEKYRHGTMATASTQGYLVHNVLLRRFCIDHQTVFGIDASEDPDAPEDGSDDTEHPSKRKRVQKQKGRIPEGTDFWSKVDLWFKEGIEQRGEDFASEAWRSYIDTSIRLDNARYQAFIQSQSRGGVNESVLAFTPGPGDLSPSSSSELWQVPNRGVSQTSNPSHQEHSSSPSSTSSTSAQAPSFVNAILQSAQPATLFNRSNRY